MDMKTNERNENLNGTAFSKACRECVGTILAEIRNAREVILTEARKTVHVQERWLRLAVNQAEGLAWQTLYPQLVFPDLAAEKIQRVVKWIQRKTKE
jgi:hypothetical protein